MEWLERFEALQENQHYVAHIVVFGIQVMGDLLECDPNHKEKTIYLEDFELHNIYDEGFVEVKDKGVEVEDKDHAHEDVDLFLDERVGHSRRLEF